MTRLVCGRYSVLAALLTFALAVVATPGNVATAAPPGDIWQWALGRNISTDPDLTQYFHPVVQCGSEEHCPGWAQSLDDGWKANPGSDGNVVSVELFNDETALGTPNNPNIASTSSEALKHAYKGRLPLGKTWSTTAKDMGAVYGARNMIFGRNAYLEIPITFEYFTDDGQYKIWFEFYAMTEGGLPDAFIHKIEVFHSPNH